MGELEKGFRLLNETELNEVHGGTGGQEQTMAICEACGWSSGWMTNYGDVKELMAAHTRETGHERFNEIGCQEIDDNDRPIRIP